MIGRCPVRAPRRIEKIGGQPMGTPSLLDALVIAPAAILGLLGVWLGFVRSLAAAPMRWLLPVLGAYVAARPTELYLRGLSSPGAVGLGVVAYAVAFLVPLALLAMFMTNLRSRVAVWTRERRIGLSERALGGLVGIVCGAILIGLVLSYTPLWRASDGEPAWARGSVVLPYLRSGGAVIEGALRSYLPYLVGPERG
jgi:hypothetical protein